MEGTKTVNLLEQSYVFYMPINVCGDMHSHVLHNLDPLGYIAGQPKLADPEDPSKGWIGCVDKLSNKDEIIAEVNRIFHDDVPSAGIVEYHTRIPKDTIIQIFNESFETGE